nr:reverse transcriptase domain-containing protein [Tanacetum cinerariifolium]
RRSSKQKVENSNLEENLPPVVTMADNHTMAELLHVPTEGYKDLLRACPHHGFTELHQLNTFYNALNPVDQDSLNAAAGGNLLERTLVKAVEEICVTCGGAHPYYQCHAAGGNTFPEFKDNIQGYVSAAAVNYNQGNPGYRPQGVANQMRPPGFAQPNVQNNQNRFGPPQGFNRGNNFNQEQSYQATAQQNQNFHLNELEKIKRMNEQEKDEVEIQKFWQMFKQLHINITLADALVLMPKYQKMLKALLSNKEKLQELANTPLNENCSVVILKKLPKKLEDPGKFLISCSFSALKCKALANLGASINLVPLFVWKELGLPELIPTHMTLKLANRAICTPAGIARDVFVPVGKFTFPADFVIVDYESDPRVPLILGRHFLRTARALIDVHELTLSEVTNDIFDSEGCNVLSEKWLDLHSTNDLHPLLDDNPLSGSTTYSSNSLLEEFTDELALSTYPSNYDDNLQFDIKSDLKEIEFFLYQGKDSSLKNSIDQKDLSNLDDNFVDPIHEMFTDEHALDYSSPPIFDVCDDDFLEVESDVENVYDDPFD